MMDAFDVTVIGAGPVGSVAALAHAKRGARVLLLEANPNSAHRLAGEWLHPPAVAILKHLGIELPGMTSGYAKGQGFVVFPETGDDPIMLPYISAASGWSGRHELLVSTLRQAAQGHSNISYLPNRRVVQVDANTVQFKTRGRERLSTVSSERIVGADGRASVMRAALGLSIEHVTCSHMIGVLLKEVTLPYEGYGHVLMGGPGPVLAYRMLSGEVRVILDVPLSHWKPGDRAAYLNEAYARILPKGLRPEFRRALGSGEFGAASNQVRPRTFYGRGGLVLVGDATGHYHPLTAVGMTLGFADALCLAESASVDDYAAARSKESRVPELLAMNLYEMFADQSEVAMAVRHAVYRHWHNNPKVRQRTMAYLACQDTRFPHFLASFLQSIGGAMIHVAGDAALRKDHWRNAVEIAGVLTRRCRFLVRGLSQLRATSRSDNSAADEQSIRDTLSVALPVSMKCHRKRRNSSRSKDVRREIAANTSDAVLHSAVEVLTGYQNNAGAWEGEVVWCPMLAAQYVLMCHITGTPISDQRKVRLLQHFRSTRLDQVLWGLHPHAPPYLFVTTLVYVASRLLGMDKSDSLLQPAIKFIQAEGGVLAIPSWGKFWLAMLNLYDWRGVNPVLPEIWLLPRWMPAHPSNFYCHTRLIYLAMSAIYGHRYQAPLSPVIVELRDELYLGNYDTINFNKGRFALRRQDLYAPPNVALRLIFRAAVWVDRFHSPARRFGLLKTIEERIRWELKTSDYTSISPVSGLLNIIALWLKNPEDADLKCALARFEGWIWEDDAGGARVAGARSATWDTGFALQTLTAVTPHIDVSEAISRGTAFIEKQQIRKSFDGYQQAYRINPKGGWCFAGVWHGWPVSDCTAEAMTALLYAPEQEIDRQAMLEGVSFLLRCQNRDGGFGSYEARRSRLDLEWLNPAEMFADSMTEHSFVECTASCIAALDAFLRHFPDDPRAVDIRSRSDSAARWLQNVQQPDGAWRGVWGVCFIYGTWFGVRGLLAAGVPAYYPSIRKACLWLLDRQRDDGGWGEHHTSCLTGRYTPLDHSQVIQTAWAMTCLLEAGEPDWEPIERAAEFLARCQDRDGCWPKQEMVGVFFRTALLDYTLYRQYFPVWAMALYETRRKARGDFDRAADEQPLAAARRLG